MVDFYPLIARAVERLPEQSPERRRAIYERARSALAAQLRAPSPSSLNQGRVRGLSFSAGQLELRPMLKTMFVLVVISGQYYPAPVVLSQHSTREKCEQAYKAFNAQIARKHKRLAIGYSMYTTETPCKMHGVSVSAGRCTGMPTPSA